MMDLTGETEVESHPLQPFLPPNARLLMLGSFPPQRKRWSMDFYYPNWQNDMWRIFGLVFFSDPGHFVVPGAKAFDRGRIIDFLDDIGIALYDSATEVRRLQGNASDRFLDVVQPADLSSLLRHLPLCRAVAVTGQKSADVMCAITGAAMPKVGTSTGFEYMGRMMRLYRMPSSSRAYPMRLDDKAAVYAGMFDEIFGRRQWRTAPMNG